MKTLLLTLFLASPILGQMWPWNGPGYPQGGGGGGGGTCTGSTNWVETATHAYAITDSSWAVAGDPEDECDQHGASCTPVDLETSTGLTDADDVKTATPPAGSHANAVYWDLNNATSEVAKTATKLRYVVTLSGLFVVCVGQGNGMWSSATVLY